MSAFHSPPDVPWEDLPDPVIPDPTVPDIRKPKHPEHYHKDEYGLWVKCYHQCRGLLTNWQFWLGLTFGFPLEHLLWEKVWPFYLLTRALGL